MDFIYKTQNTLPVFGYLLQIHWIKLLTVEKSIRSGVLFYKSRSSKMASIKTNKNKNGQLFWRPTFDDKKICLWAPNDIFTLKFLKTQFFFGWAILNKKDCRLNVQCFISYKFSFISFDDPLFHSKHFLFLWKSNIITL